MAKRKGRKGKGKGKKKGKRQRGGAYARTAVYRPPILSMNNLYGQGFFGDLWSGIKSIGSKANDFLKNTKLISTAGNLAGDLLGPSKYGVIGKSVGNIADQFGYGKGRRSMGGRGKVATGNGFAVIVS